MSTTDASLPPLPPHPEHYHVWTEREAQCLADFASRCYAAGKRAALAQQAPVAERAWLVEWRFNGVQWLYLWPRAAGGFSFTGDANRALRFARREDAEAALQWARDTDSRRGAGRATGDLLVTEHEWPAALAARSDLADPDLHPDIGALQQALAADPGFRAAVTGEPAAQQAPAAEPVALMHHYRDPKNAVRYCEASVGPWDPRPGFEWTHSEPLFATPQPHQPAARPVAPAGYALVPLRPTRAMEDVMRQDEWEWADLLAAAESITLEQYEEATAPQPPQAQPLSSGLTPMDRFEDAIREVGVVAACEWFGHAPDSEFTKETIRVLAERKGAA